MKPFSKLPGYLFMENIGFMLQEIDYSWKFFVVPLLYDKSLWRHRQLLMNSLNSSCNNVGFSSGVCNFA